MFINLNYLNLASKKIEELSEIKFLSEKNEGLKTDIIVALSNGRESSSIKSEVINGYDKIIKEINENSNIQIISKNKDDQNVLELLDELIEDHKEQSNLKKIESLEQKLINNLDENSYSELLKLKSQLNRD